MDTATFTILDHTRTMFCFNFNINETTDNEQTVIGPAGSRTATKPQTAVTPQPFSEVTLDTLVRANCTCYLHLGSNSTDKVQLRALPSKISYSILTIPLSNGTILTFARRDLFDARFQLISEGTGDQGGPEQAEIRSALQFLENPSDLVPFVYEGGLKTWECSLDLVTYLSGISYCANQNTSTRILEVGTGA